MIGGADPDRVTVPSETLDLRDSHPEDVARLPSGCTRCTATAVGLNTATADSPSVQPSSAIPYTAPATVSRNPSRTLPAIRLIPAIRAANALRGRARTCSTGPSSTIRPASSTTTRSASERASSTSWVTTIAVRSPVRRTRRSSARTAGPTPTSRAAIGSSSRSNRGPAASARAIATRCACPPDSCRGRRPASSVASTSPSHRSATAYASRRPAPALRGANATFSRTVRCGNSSASCASIATER